LEKGYTFLCNRFIVKAKVVVILVETKDPKIMQTLVFGREMEK